jgi:hypothetical protein
MSDNEDLGAASCEFECRVVPHSARCAREQDRLSVHACADRAVLVMSAR